MIDLLNDTNRDIIVAHGKDDRPIYNNSKVCYDSNHYGRVYYSHSDCRFKIRWDDHSERRLDSLFAKELEVL